MKNKKNKISAFQIMNYCILAVSVIAALYIMANGLGLIDSLDFGAGAYYYADIPEFAKYTDSVRDVSSPPMWLLITLFLIWGFFMYKVWGWIERKGKR
ncbi:MAG: hypothetical protein Q4E91_06445 [Lachnospiraceae bacterium]|nr:hypothetical protein [Lachnospiraceae bacterium]